MNYYKILELHESATGAEIKSAFRNLAKKYHPDVNPGDIGAEKKSKEISEAYSILKNPQKRAEYDNIRKYSIPQKRNDGWRTSGDNIQDILNEMFRRNGMGGRYGFNPTNQDFMAALNISLEQSFTGHSLTIDNPEGKTVIIKIPPGAMNGQQFRIKGAGESTHKNIAPGDLIVEIRILHHERFIVFPNGELITELKISPIDAIIGGEYEIIGIDKIKLKVKIPVNTKFGQKLRVAKHGMPKLLNKRADLIVQVLFEMPNNLTNFELDLLKKFKTSYNNRRKAGK